MRLFIEWTTGSPLGLLGSALATVTASGLLLMMGLGLVGYHGGPYAGILTFMVLPALFVVGLLLIPVGLWWQRRRGTRSAELPVVDLNKAHIRNSVLLFLGLSVINVGILGTAGVHSIHVLDSTEFCGTACHRVMEPEYVAYLRSPHSRVECVECHIGEGASWFVKSKLSGAWQVVSVNLDLYPRPIEAPIHNLRPARDTCEQCHWPTRFVGDRLQVRTHYAEDEASTELKTVTLLKVGGIQGREGEGIHWHVDPEVEVRFLSDRSREHVYDVVLVERDGSETLFSGPEPPAEAELEWRTMDCVDCHNRPTHIYQYPEEALDLALLEGRISRELPFIRKHGLAALQAEYPTHDEARTGISAELRAHYPDQDEALVAQTAEVLGELYTTNVFPKMNITWGTYPSHLGHQQSPGCFRCHDGQHVTEGGEAISMDCAQCHTLLAMSQEDPPILEQLNP